MIAPLTEEQIKSYYTSPTEEGEEKVEEVMIETVKEETIEEENVVKEEEVVVEKQRTEDEDVAEQVEEVPKEEKNEETAPKEDEYIRRVVKSAVFRAKELEQEMGENSKESKKGDVPMMETNAWNAMNAGLRERGNNSLPFVPIYVPVIVVVKEKEKNDNGSNPKPAKFQQVLGALIPLITTLIYFYFSGRIWLFDTITKNK